MACSTICLIIVVISCGSTWHIEGNKIEIQKKENDTIITKENLFILNDSSLTKDEK